MRKRIGVAAFAALVGFLLVTTVADARPQPPGGKGGKDKDKGGKGPGGFGFGPPGGQEIKLVKQFDKDNNGWLNAEERAAAREHLKNERAGGKGGFGMKGGFGKGGFGGDLPKPGPQVNPAEVKTFADTGMYDPTSFRTVFLEFENKDWEMELQDFHGTDVDVAATLVVDGKRYPNVGVHFRGMSSYMGVPAGYKRSLNVSVDMADPKQRVYGYKTLNLLNSHDDPSMMSTVMYSHIARKYIPTPKANFVKVVINGESWGVYTNVQQFDKEFLNDFYKSTAGTRWKVRGSPGGASGLEYTGDNIEDYKRRFQMKGNDDEKAWKALINLCKVLNTTPPDKLEAALRPILDIEGVLWFLALDVALINNDGYWVRSSDYSIYLDGKGKFHVVPHDMNEAFTGAMGGPGMGGPGGGMRIMMPAAGEVLPPPIQDMLGLTDAQKKQLAELQKDVDGKLDKLLTAEQRAQLKTMRDGALAFGGPGGPGGFGGPPGGGFGGPPGGFGPPGGGPGGPGGMGPGRGVELDPLVALDDPRKPLRSKLLAVPTLKAKYLECVRTIAADSLDWKKMGPVIAQFRTLIEKDVEIDTRKLASFEAFKRMTADTVDAAPAGGPPGGPGAGGPPGGPGGGFGGPRGPGGPGGGGMPLRAFFEQRQKYLLNHPQVIKKSEP